MQSGRDWKNSYRGDEQYDYRREDDRDRHRREKGKSLMSFMLTFKMWKRMKF